MTRWAFRVLRGGVRGAPEERAQRTCARNGADRAHTHVTSCERVRALPQAGLVLGFLLLIGTTAGVAYLNFQGWQDEREIKKMNEQFQFDKAIGDAGLKAGEGDSQKKQRSISKKGRGFGGK